MSRPYLSLEQIYNECGTIAKSKRAFNHWLGYKARQNISPRPVVVGQVEVHFVSFSVNPPYHYQVVNGRQTRLDLTPMEARRSMTTYAGDAYVNVVVVLPGGERVKIDDVCIGRIPIMLHSDYCHLKGLSPEQLRELGEDPSDPGGYFIVNGQEKNIIHQEYLRINAPLVIPIKERPQVRLTIRTKYGTSVFEIGLSKKNGAIKAYFCKLDKTDRKSRRAKINVIRVFRLLNNMEVPEIMEMVGRYIPEEIRQPCLDQLTPSVSQVYLSKELNNDLAVLARHVPGYAGRLTQDIAKRLIEDDMFPHIMEEPPLDGETAIEHEQRRTLKQLETLASMVATMCEFRAGYRGYDNRNSWSNKRSEGPARMLEKLLRSTWRSTMSALEENLKQRHTMGAAASFVTDNEQLLASTTLAIQTILGDGTITNDLQSSLATGKWSGRGAKVDYNISATMEAMNQNNGISNRISIGLSVSSTDRNMEPREVDPAGLGFICPVFSTDDRNIGLSKRHALSSSPSLYIEADAIRPALVILVREGLLYANEAEARAAGITKPTYLMFNGELEGACDGPATRARLVEMRRTQLLEAEASVVLTGYWLYLDISCSRLVRPLYVVDVESQRLVADLLVEQGVLDPDASYTVADLMQHGAVEMLSAWEQEQPSCMLAVRDEDLEARFTRMDDLANELESAEPGTQYHLSLTQELQRLIANPYTHMELDPVCILDPISATIPYANHNQGPRNTYQRKMAEQALSEPHAARRYRFDGTLKTLSMPQAPLIYTRMDRILGNLTHGLGHNVPLAFQSATETMEDAYKFNKGAIDRGMGRAILYHTYTRLIVAAEGETIEFPKIAVHDNAGRYRALDTKTGLPIIGAAVGNRDAILGKTILTPSGAKVNASVYMKPFEQGVIDNVKVAEREKSLVVIVKIRVSHRPECGDKLTPRCAQKGTIGNSLPEQLMPRTADGVIPVVIINSHSMPSRMTGSLPLEMYLGKAAAFSGQAEYADAFLPRNVAEAHRVLVARGYDRPDEVSGRELLYNPLTGEVIPNAVMMGMVTISFLRHLVRNKIQARFRGRFNSKTRQSPKGRAVNGGLRFGEMERDSLVSHGAAGMIYDRLLAAANPYEAAFCLECGAFAVNSLMEGEDYRPCSLCGSSNFGRTEIPYAYKYLMNVSAGMGNYLRPGFKPVARDEGVPAAYEFVEGEEELSDQEAELSDGDLDFDQYNLAELDLGGDAGGETDYGDAGPGW